MYKRQVHAVGAAVDNGFLLCAEVAAADDLLAQGHNKLRLQNTRIRPVAVFLRHIHSVDTVSYTHLDVYKRQLKFFKEQAVKQFPVVCVKPQNRLIKDYIRNIQ